MGLLVLTRHGITQYNQEKRFTGFIDISITDEGKEQARQVGRDLAKRQITFQRAYTSWLKRSWETLDILLSELNQLSTPITKHPFLNERHYGDLQGVLHSDMAQKYSPEQVQIWRRSYSVRPPNGECLADVVVRTQYYLANEIMPKVQAGENILVCAHGNSNRAMVKQLENISDEEIVKREITYDEALIYDISSSGEVHRIN